MNLRELAHMQRSVNLLSRIRPKNPRARLAEIDVVNIFKIKDLIQATKVAKCFGVSEKAIRDIWSGRTWVKATRHLDPSKVLNKQPPARPKGSKDTTPRKKCTLYRNIDGISKQIPQVAAIPDVCIYAPPSFGSSNSIDLIPDNQNYALASGQDEEDALLSSKDKLQSIIEGEPVCADYSRDHISLDDQLYIWNHEIWRSTALHCDPFGQDWVRAQISMKSSAF